LGVRGYTKPHMKIHQTLSFPTPTQKKESGLGTRLRFKLKDSELNTSAINAIPAAKSSTKPWGSATTNRYLRGSGERNQE